MCFSEGAADLAGDLTLTHHNGVQARCNGEEMLRRRRSGRVPEQRGEPGRGQARAEADRIEGLGASGINMVPGRHLAVDFEAAAGGHDHGPGHGGTAGEQMLAQVRGNGVEPGGGLNV